MGTNCAPLITDLFLYCYECQFMAQLQEETQTYLFTQQEQSILT